MTYSGAVDLTANRTNRFPPCCVPPCYECGIRGKERHHCSNQQHARDGVSHSFHHMAKAAALVLSVQTLLSSEFLSELPPAVANRLH
jgi:hypothetical protein